MIATTESIVLGKNSERGREQVEREHRRGSQRRAL